MQSCRGCACVYLPVTIWRALIQQPCLRLRESAGMFWPDWEHYVEELGDATITTPAAYNTLFWRGAAPAPVLSSSAVEIALDSLKTALAEKRDQQVIFVASAFSLVAPLPRDLDQKLQLATNTDCEFFVLNPEWPQT